MIAYNPVIALGNQAIHYRALCRRLFLLSRAIRPTSTVNFEQHAPLPLALAGMCSHNERRIADRRTIWRLESSSMDK